MRITSERERAWEWADATWSQFSDLTPRFYAHVHYWYPDRFVQRFVCNNALSRKGDHKPLFTTGSFNHCESWYAGG